MSETADIPDDEEEVPAEIARCRAARPLWAEHYPPCPDAWRSERVRALLNGILAEQAYDRLPILADALEEAGCEDVLLLRHCRECAEHDMTCWVLRAYLANTETLEWELAPTVAQQRAVEAIAESVRRAQQWERYAEEPRTRFRTLGLISLALVAFLLLASSGIVAFLARSTSEQSLKPQVQPLKSRPTERVSHSSRATPR